MQGTPDVPLLRWLRKNHGEYHQKALEVRTEVAKWLTDVPQAFPHYTRHTIDHSDELVHQMSSILFRGSRQSRPVIGDLSPTEVYILTSAAYLHDAGMVVSDGDKQRSDQMTGALGLATGGLGRFVGPT